MTPYEYRQKHKRCITCTYWFPDSIDNGLCAISRLSKRPTQGKFCKMYNACKSNAPYIPASAFRMISDCRD